MEKCELKRYKKDIPKQKKVDNLKVYRKGNKLMKNNSFQNLIYRKDNKLMKSYSSREVIKILENDGWYLVNVVGSHHQFKHPIKKGRTTVKHPDKDIPLPTLKIIEKQSDIKFP